MSRPQVSVAMITYNGGSVVAEQLRSIIRQTSPPDEIVVVDDRSSDSTVGLVDECLSEFGGRAEVLVNERRLGARGNAARGLALTSGDVVLLADQDDRWKPQKVERQLALLDGERADLVFSDADLIDADGRSLGRRLWPAVGFGPKELADWRDGSPLNVLLKRPVVTGATVAIRRTLLETALPIPEFGWHDMWIALAGAVVGARMHASAEPLVDYRVHDNTVGLAPRSPWARWQRRPVAGWHHEQQRRLDEAALERFDAAMPQATRELIRRHREFVIFRESLPPARLERAGQVARAALRGDYGRFTFGWRTALADCVDRRSPPVEASSG